MMNKKKLLLLFSLLFISYSVGFISAKFKLFPYTYLQSAAGSLNEDYESISLKQKLFNHYFDSPISFQDSLLYPPLKSMSGLEQSINRFKRNQYSLDSIYSRIKIVSMAESKHIRTITFSISNQLDTVYAYYKKGSRENSIGVNIIPGSGKNQSSEIYYKNKIEENYQSNIDNISQQYGDTYIYVKPNEDFLAVHNGKQKISEVAYVNYLLNLGYSYSKNYLIQTIALTKFIKENYEQAFVCGLSQGGHATLLNAIYSEPDKVLIASGFSILRKAPFRSNPDQLIIPNEHIYDKQFIYQKINSSTTEFFFTWGTAEQSSYGIDAQDTLTKAYFSKLKNVSCYIHAKGHIYDEKAVLNFFEN